MAYTERFFEKHAVLGVLYPASYASEQNLGWYAVQNYHRIAILVIGGNIGTSLDVDVEIATDADGSDVHTLKSITQLTQAGSDDDSYVGIEIQSEELSKPAGTSVTNFTHLRVEVTPSGATLACVVVLGVNPRFAPVSTTGFDEIVD